MTPQALHEEGYALRPKGCGKAMEQHPKVKQSLAFASRDRKKLGQLSELGGVQGFL